MKIRRHIKLATLAIITPFILFLLVVVTKDYLTIDNVLSLEELKQGNLKILGIAIGCILSVYWRDIYTWKKTKELVNGERKLTEKVMSNIAHNAAITHYLVLAVAITALTHTLFRFG